MDATNSVLTSLIQLLTVLGASGGLFTIIRAWIDYRDGVSAREGESDERFYKRLEERLAKSEARVDLVEEQLRAEKNYTSILILSLVSQGLKVPPRA